MEFPYGGFAPGAPNPDDAPWPSLHEIQRQLERGEPLSPRLARWLGDAIKHSGDDPDEFMRRIGLRKGKGRPSPHPRDAWLFWGQRVEQERDKGLSPERAISAVLDQMSESGLWDELPDRATMQRWAKTWAQAWNAQCAEWQSIEDRLCVPAPASDDPFHDRRQRMRDLLAAWRAEAAELKRLEETQALPQALREKVEELDRALAAMMEGIKRA